MATRASGKAYQLVIKFDFPKRLDELLATLPQDIQKKSVRAGIRAAMRPVRSRLKGLVKTISRVNKGQRPSQSTGALYRSIELKYGSPKNRPAGFYGMVGANRRHIEVLTNRFPERSKGKYLQYRLKKSYKSDYKNKRKLKATLKGVGPSEVKSLYRRKRRGTGKPIKRGPSRYFHLVDKGFNHYSGTSVPGRNFVQQTYDTTVAVAQTQFVNNVTASIHQIFTKIKS